jgi:hypothetical protein
MGRFLLVLVALLPLWTLLINAQAVSYHTLRLSAFVQLAQT